MDYSVEYKRMKEENQVFRSHVECVNIEKMAITNQLNKKINELIEIEKECVKRDIEIQKLKNEIEKLKSDISSLRSQLDQDTGSDTL